MSNWEEGNYNDDAHSWVSSALAALPMTAFQQVTTKVPPAFNGLTSWFTFEELIDDWTDITELDAEKQGPALRNRLEGDAAVYKPLLDRYLLKDPNDGVAYFKRTMRPHFIKGNQSVFMWRLFQLMKFNRGSQDFLRWIGKFSVVRKRLSDSWVDLFEEVDENNPVYLAALAAVNANLADGVPRFIAANYIEEYNDRQRQHHMNSFPINDNLMSLIFTVLADLQETQRERMTSTLTLRGRNVQNYTFEAVREVFVELFCAPKSSLDNPNLRASGVEGRQRNFCVIDSGELDGSSGYWVEDDDSCEAGFIPEFEDVFWVFDDQQECWASHHFKGRHMRKGGARKGGKGKGYKGYKRFVPSYKKKGGKGQAKISQEGTVNLSKGRGKGKGKKGKSKGQNDPAPEAGSKGKGKGSKTWTASDEIPAPETTSPVEDNTWQDGWSEDTWWSSNDWSSSFFVEHQERENYHTFLSAWENHLDLKTNPTFAVLDLGCTRAMASRYAVNKFTEHAASLGIDYEILPTTSHFTFANSQTDTVTEKIRVHLPTRPPCWTEFDILEKGTVPLLFSLPQMRNLYFKLDLEPDVVYLTCQAFGYHRVPLRSSTSKHLVINLADIVKAPQDKNFQVTPVFM